MTSHNPTDIAERYCAQSTMDRVRGLAGLAPADDDPYMPKCSLCGEYHYGGKCG